MPSPVLRGLFPLGQAVAKHETPAMAEGWGAGGRRCSQHSRGSTFAAPAPAPQAAEVPGGEARAPLARPA